jgi:hypothetical protein
MEIKSS